MNTPIAFIIFNRPQTTKRIFEAIRQTRPKWLLLVSDGPRTDRSDDQEKCAAVRTIVEKVDWPCEVKRDYAKLNLGCRARIKSGLDWVFSHVDRAIILEDDCLPHPSFFPYCSELLNRYANDTRVGSISGDNFQPEGFHCDASYYFSRFFHCWGWATWRRTWERHDDTMRLWPKLRKSAWLEGQFPVSLQARYWQERFDSVYNQQLDTWDYPFLFTCWSQNFLTVLPRTNLVTNIGTGPDATHMQEESHLTYRKSNAMDLPLLHPECMSPDYRADAYTQAQVYGATKDRSLRGRLKRVGYKCIQLPSRLVRIHW